jgi:calcium homeostasis ER protein
LLGGGGGGVPGLQVANLPPGVPLADLSRPPPGFITPQETIPALPYYDLPAGLMVPLVSMEDSGYKPLDPEKIRLPPPQPPNERLLAAVEMFYSPPSHERPRDPEGWERLGLYEWAREKHYAMKRKQEDIEVNIFVILISDFSFCTCIYFFRPLFETFKSLNR